MTSGPDDPNRRPPRATPQRIDPRATPGSPVPPRQTPPGRAPARRLPPPVRGGASEYRQRDLRAQGRHERASRGTAGIPPAALAEEEIDLLEESSSTGLARDTDSSIVRTSGSIALATLTSRITGFVRTVLILALLGATLASAFNAADVLPNMIAEVVLGAVLTAIVIPLLARAEAEDADGGRSFINKIFTLTVTVLGGATVIAVIAAPLLTSLNIDNDEIRPLATALAYFLLIEILFYGLTALFIAILNLKGFFKPGAWAPVLNNVVQIATLTIFWSMGPFTLNPISMTDPQLLVLGIGCTLGVVLQALVLVPWIRRSGVQLRLEWGIDDRLKKFGNMAVAIVTYVAILQIGMVITYRIASAATSEGISVYNTHWQLLQLPYGVLGVTILTAIMPRLSRNAAVNDDTAVVDDMSLATRLTMVALVPVVSFMTFFGPAIGIAVFNFGEFNAAVASQLGSVLAWGAFTLIPYSMTLVQLRVFYARADAWTPTFMVLGITVVKVVSSYLGPVLFDNPDMVIRWLALSNGLGYLVGAIVGHYLLSKRLGNAHLTDVTRTTVVTIGISLVVGAAVWAIANMSGLHRLSTHYGKIGSLAYLLIMAVVVLGVIYAGLAAAKVPDVVAIFAAVQRLAGRFIPALAPAAPADDNQPLPTITVQFPRISDEETLPYSGQVQVVRRFDRGTASWQSYAVHTGGATSERQAYVGPPPVPRSTTRYRRRGFAQVSDTDIDATQGQAEPEPTTIIPTADDSSVPKDSTSAAAPGVENPDESSESVVAHDPPAVVPPTRRARGPRLVPGAAIAGGRYRLLDHHGGTRGLKFWRARDINLDREVGLTFVDADQLAAPPERGQTVRPSDSGPQAVLTRTMRLGQISSPGVARVLDVVRGSSGGIVVSEWVPGSSLADVAGSEPSAIGAARAVRALAAAAELAHRSGGALSIDHPDRIRISEDGNAVLAFPGTLAGDDKASDVRGLGAVLYALLLDRWPLDAATGTEVITTDATTEPIGGLQVAEPGKAGAPIEPRDARESIPFEISAVASRALDGNRGIRTAATVQHVLDQATVLDLQTDMLPVIDSDTPPVAMAAPRRSTADPATQAKERKRNVALLVGAALFTLFLVLALIAWMTNILGGGDDATNIDSILTTSQPAEQNEGQNGEQAATAIPLQSVTLVDFSTQPPDDTTNLSNVISGAAPAWKTDLYRGSADFGGLKDGLGLMFNLGGEKAVKTVTITSPTPGFAVSLRTSTTATPTSLSQTREVATGTVNQGTTTLSITDPQSAPVLLVWITSLVQASNGYQVQIGEVQLAG